jgi:hypothetical protein
MKRMEGMEGKVRDVIAISGRKLPSFCASAAQIQGLPVSR